MPGVDKIIETFRNCNKRVFYGNKTWGEVEF